MNEVHHHRHRQWHDVTAVRLYIQNILKGGPSSVHYVKTDPLLRFHFGPVFSTPFSLVLRLPRSMALWQHGRRSRSAAESRLHDGAMLRRRDAREAGPNIKTLSAHSKIVAFVLIC
jgi:hypothetical protein